LDALLAWRKNAAKSTRRTYPYVGNQSDASQMPSLLISEDVLLRCRTVRIGEEGATTGNPLEIAVRVDMEHTLRALDPSRPWTIDNERLVSEFQQYSHLSVLELAVKHDVVLRTEFGRDYRIKPDVTIGVDQGPGEAPLLHAVISCKWSMRSDRVQNVRPEGATLVRHRRGRAPHFVVVTCEPLPSRIAAIAMTTGEVDAVYHLAFDETAAAVHAIGTVAQRDTWDELVAQRRLRDYNVLADTVAVT
jgi:hypothetical protein